MASRRLLLAFTVFGLLGLAAVGLLYYRDGGGEGARGPADAGASAGSVAADPAAGGAPLLEPPGGSDRARVAGTVREAVTGAPIGGVEVLFRSEGAEASAAAGDDGRYRAELAPGRYRVRAVGDGVATLGERELDLAAGARAEELDLEAYTLARIAGRVVDADGRPSGGVRIRHQTELLDRTLTSEDTAPAGSAESGAGGAFEIEVPPGEVTLVAAGRPPGRTLLPWVEPGAELRGVEIVLDHPGRLAGRVEDEGGEPVASARVVATGAVPGWRASALTGAGGTFSFETLPAGAVRVQATAGGYAPSEPAEVAVAPGEAGEEVVLVVGEAFEVRGRVVDGEGAPIAGARVWAEPGGESESESALPPPEVESGGRGRFVLAGLGGGPRVLRAEAPGFAGGRAEVEAPDEGIEIVLRAAGAIAGTVRAGGEPLAVFTVDAGVLGRRFAAGDGSYRLGGLAPGTYDVEISAPGYAPALIPRVEVPAGGVAEASARLERGGTIEGEVTAAATGAPIRGASVRVSTGHRGALAYTDRSGGFELRDVAPGRRSVEVSHPGYVSRIESGVEVEAGDRARVRFSLEALSPDAERTFEIAGIGAALRDVEGGLQVAGVLAGGPAEAVGLEEGDLVVTIDGERAAGRAFPTNIEAIRGVAGTTVRLGIQRGEERLEQDVVRANVRFQSGGED